MREIAVVMTDHLIACGRTGATLDELAACVGLDLGLAGAVLHGVVLRRHIAEARDDRFYIRLVPPGSER